MKTSSSESKICFGSEVYTWFMKGNGVANANRLAHIMEVIGKSGFTGIQPIFSWMGDLADPGRFREALAANGLKLAAMSFVLEWNHERETAEELAQAQEVMDFLQRFPGALLCMVQKPTGRFDLEERRKRLIGNLNSLARRAADRGIRCTFHPNSPHTSIARTREDYDVLLNCLDRRVLGWTPDVGHIINAGMDPLAVMKEFAELIDHVHYKDWDGYPEFAVMGQGKVDFVGITQWLRDTGYAGWIICEDEGLPAIEDPDGVTLADGSYVRERLLPSLH